MIQNDLSTQLQLLIKTSAPPLLEVSQQQLELPQLVPGQKVPAFVVANLPNGRFQVLIADKMLDMNLPKNTQPGDTVDLVFVTTQPRLTFVLASDLANVANSASMANAKPQVSLSETARFLGGLLEKAAQPDSAKGMASAVAQATPLLSGAPAKTLDFAQALRGALTQSGLFYESHQAQWVTGQRPLTDLLREPQGRLSPTAASQPQALQGGTSPQPEITGTVNAKAPEHTQQHLSNPQSSMTGTVNAQVTEQRQQQLSNLQHSIDTQPSKALASGQIAHPDTLPLVRQQLEVLDSRQVAWQGQVWPGQTMDWKIEERSAREQSSEIAMPEWQTSLRLVLPQLGEIAAKLTLHPQGIRIQLDASEPASAKLLAEQRIALQQGMETSGLQLVDMKVRHETEG
ncbi:MAG: flagellar hook-length control protein FliK [Sulfurimicrobium sp.]|nr:flagellar hook-length control protein FliK [Sulfurimicrobium sp.]